MLGYSEMKKKNNIKKEVKKIKKTVDSMVNKRRSQREPDLWKEIRSNLKPLSQAYNKFREKRRIAKQKEEERRLKEQEEQKLREEAALRLKEQAERRFKKRNAKCSELQEFNHVCCQKLLRKVNDRFRRNKKKTSISF